METGGAIDLSVVIPCYNERERLLKFVPGIVSYLAGKNLRFEVIVVDDGSKDDTAAVARTLPVRLISYKPNRGKGGALKEGMLAGNGRWVMFTDADQSTPIGEVDKLLAKLEAGYDMAIGSRGVPGAEVKQPQAWYRALAGKMFGAATRMLCVRGIYDTQYGFKAMTRDAAGKIFARHPRVRAVRGARRGVRNQDADRRCQQRHGGARVEPAGGADHRRPVPRRAGQSGGRGSGVAAGIEQARASTYKAIPIGLFTADECGALVQTNPAFRTIVGLGREAAKRARWSDLFPAHDWKTVIDVTTHSVRELEVHRSALTGEERWYVVHATRSGDVVEGSLQDVTERKTANERLRFLADHDPLTGPGNPGCRAGSGQVAH